MKQALARADRGGDLVALMFLDLDRFKTVNDTLGHAYGDELLKTVARRIRGRVREIDTVARLGGDEFAVILEGLSDVQDAAPLAREILEILSQPCTLAGRDIFTTASIGISSYPQSRADDLVKDADAAMYRAKERGRNNYEFYTKEMNIQVFERLALESSLRLALSREEYVLY